MQIEILDAYGNVITKIVGVVDAQAEFEEHYMEMYSAVSWRVYSEVFRYAVVAANIVTSIVATSDVLDSLTNIRIGSYADVQVGYTYADGAFTAPVHVQTKDELLATLDATYKPRFLELSQALGMATLADNLTLISSIKLEYTGLKLEYDTEREVIQNG